MSIPRDVSFALTEEFLSAPQKTKQWFLERLSSKKEAALSLVEVGEMLRAFLVPCLLPPKDSPLAHWTPNVGVTPSLIRTATPRSRVIADG
jgi:hypothetical protein